MKKQQSQPNTFPTTSIDGTITKVSVQSVLFETVFCKCFQPVCSCDKTKLVLPISQCSTSQTNWQTGKAIVKMPLWLLRKECQDLSFI